MWDSVTEGCRRGHDDLVLAAWLTEEDRERVRERYRRLTLANLEAQLPRGESTDTPLCWRLRTHVRPRENRVRFLAQFRLEGRLVGDEGATFQSDLGVVVRILPV